MRAGCHRGASFRVPPRFAVSSSVHNPMSPNLPAADTSVTLLASNMTTLLAEITRAELSIDDVLSIACAHARRIANAEAAAIEMVDGAELVYRAASGSLERHVGLRLPLTGSLSGLAVEKSAVQSSRDTESDERVNREMCRKVGVRSMVIVPLTFGDTSVGVLKVAWSKPDGFDDTAVSSLVLMTGMLAIAIRRAQEQESRRRAQLALAASEARWRSVAEQCVAGTYIVEDQRFTFANDRFCEMLGYTREQLLSLPSSLLTVDPSDRDRVRSNLKARENGEEGLVGHEVRALRSDGTPLVLQVFSSAIENGHTRSVIGTVIDVTERQRSEIALRESEGWFRTLIEGASDMIGVLTLDGVYTYCSPSVTEQLGYQLPDLIGRNAFDLIHQDDVERIRVELADLLQSESRRGTMQLRFRHAAGAWRICDVRLRVVAAPDGTPLLVANSRDITDQRSLQQQFADAERLASLGRVASSMAHEFNNVLMGIQPFADIITRVTDPARLQKAATGIQNAVRRGRTITQQVLRFTRGEQPERRSVGVTTVLEGVQQQLTSLLPANVVVEVQAESPDLRMLADSDQIEQTLVNLCLNARDAMTEGGAIRMIAESTDKLEYPFGILPQGSARFIHISVADSGPGIPEELRARIFEPLFTTKKAQGGSGLGLTIAQQIASAHHGALMVESEVGKGTTFHLFVPIATESALMRAAPQAERPAGLKRVLIVEDDDLVADAVMAALNALQIENQRVATGAAASSAAEKFHPDLALVDYGLPDMKGTAVYRILRARWPQLPIVFATGHADAASLQEEVGSDQIEICFKPFEITRLLQAMTTVLSPAS